MVKNGLKSSQVYFSFGSPTRILLKLVPLAGAFFFNHDDRFFCVALVGWLGGDPSTETSWETGFRPGSAGVDRERRAVELLA